MKLEDKGMMQINTSISRSIFCASPYYIKNTYKLSTLTITTSSHQQQPKVLNLRQWSPETYAI